MLMKVWPVLKNPPVVVALIQLKFNASDVKLSDFLRYDNQIKEILPNRQENIQVGLDFNGSKIPLGVSSISGTSDARVDSYVYFSSDKRVRFEILEGQITYIDERPYLGWNFFIDSALSCMMVFSELLNNIEIKRTSIRFINRLSFSEFSNPQEYFNTLISGTDDSPLPYPLRQYGFRLLMDIPQSEIYSIVNQQIETLNTESFLYIFDIDVLDRQHYTFSKEELEKISGNLRNIKNEIFFNNITAKTQMLCN